ncbi:MAG: hypothetical protein ACD_79C01437G0002 [uncultured bacterium]|nr:MAG: hypothetical protein ACD_79C01437G0002 [uncultured bacterium]
MNISNNQLVTWIKKRKVQRFLSVLFIGVCFIFLLSQTWCKWGNWIVDSFRDPWIAVKLLQGDILYKDINYSFGFLPPYFLSFLFKIFGVNLKYLTNLGICLSILSSILIYKITRFYLKRFFSTLCVINFLLFSVFSSFEHFSIFNFIHSYNLASVFFIFFVLSGVLTALKYIKTGRDKYLYFWSITLVLAYFSRPIMSNLIFFAYVFLWGFYGIVNKKFNARYMLVIFSPVILSLTGYLLFITHFDIFSEIKKSTVDVLVYILKGKDSFHNKQLVPVNFADTFRIIAQSFVFQFSALSIFLFLSYKMKRISNLDKITFRSLIVSILCVLSVYGFIRIWSVYLSFFDYFRCIPILLIIGICVLSYKLYKYKINNEQFGLLIIFTISLALSARMFFTASPNGYGFYFFPPSLITYYYMVSRLFPEHFGKYVAIGTEVRMRFSALLTLFLLFQMSYFYEQSMWWYKQKTINYTSARGSFFSYPDYTTFRIIQMMNYINSHTNEKDTILVMPQGEVINFFTQRNNPLSYYQFIPSLVKRVGEEKMIESIKNDKIDYIVILTRDMTLLGASVFGVDYGTKIMKWIKEKYKLEKSFGPNPIHSTEFGIGLYKKCD